MSPDLGRFFGRNASSEDGRDLASLRLAALLLGGGPALRGLEAACRLLLRGPCDLALVVGPPPADEPRLATLLGGNARGHDQTLVREALASRNSPLVDLGQLPRWIATGEDPFQPGAAFLRRFDLRWGFALPLRVDLGEGWVPCAFLAAGADATLTPDDPLIREIELLWRAVRPGLELLRAPAVRTSGNGSRGAVPAADQTWPPPEAWETAPAALVRVTSRGVASLNTAAAALLTESVGHDGSAWEPWLLGAVRRLDESGAGGEVLTASLSRSRSLEVRLGPVLPNGQGRVVVLGDATPQEARDTDRDESLSMLSHELRTPLTSMRSGLDIMSRGEAGPVSPEQERFLGMAQRNLERLDRLVGDLLDTGRTRAERRQLRLETVDLGPLLAENLAVVAVGCREKGIRLDTTGVPKSFRAGVDADRVLQMLHNVVGNAVKYTPDGGFVRVWLQERAGNLPGLSGDLARRYGLPLDAFSLVVEDSGIGMSEEFLGQLFQPFQREQRPETRRLPGAGLGLHITRGLAEAHGGDVRIDSQPGRGTTVWLVLPREPGSGSVLAAGRELERLAATAEAAGIDGRLVVLDLRARAAQARPWEVEAATGQAGDFLARLARERDKTVAASLVRGEPGPCRELTPGLVAGLALDIDRLAAAWQVCISSPQSSPLLEGSTWEHWPTAGATAPAVAKDTVGPAPTG